LPTGPMLVADQLPSDNPVKKSSLDYVAKYEAANGKGSATAFGGYAWDAGLLLANAVPQALKKAKPGSREFRAALRDALEGTKNLAAAHGVFNMTPTDHLGLDQRARVMVVVKNGAWSLVK
ncbi:MAG: branched-chain amino acid ABC transporter substrate-binding protein, partial [Rhodocyclaceae bacterium]